MRIAGIVRTSRVFGPNVELRRTISSRLGVPAIEISDQFTNRGNERVPLAWLLHINFGYPLLAPLASTYCFRGEVSPLPGSENWYRQGADYKSAPRPLDEHRGAGEFCAYIDPLADSDDRVVAGVVNRDRQFAVRIEYSKRDYPRLVNWQHWGPRGSYAGALEPTNAGVEGRPIDAARGWLTHLEPGESRALRCALSATADTGDIQRLLDLNADPR